MQFPTRCTLHNFSNTSISISTESAWATMSCIITAFACSQVLSLPLIRETFQSKFNQFSWFKHVIASYRGCVSPQECLFFSFDNFWLILRTSTNSQQHVRLSLKMIISFWFPCPSITWPKIASLFREPYMLFARLWTLASTVWFVFFAITWGDHLNQLFRTCAIFHFTEQEVRARGNPDNRLVWRVPGRS